MNKQDPQSPVAVFPVSDQLLEDETMRGYIDDRRDRFADYAKVVRLSDFLKGPSR